MPLRSYGASRFRSWGRGIWSPIIYVHAGLCRGVLPFCISLRDLGNLGWCLSSYWGCRGLRTLPLSRYSSMTMIITKYVLFTKYTPCSNCLTRINSVFPIRHQVGATVPPLQMRSLRHKGEELAMPALLPALEKVLWGGQQGCREPLEILQSGLGTEERCLNLSSLWRVLGLF